MRHYIAFFISVLYLNTCNSQNVEGIKISDISNQINFQPDRNSVLTSISSVLAFEPNKLGSVVGISNILTTKFANGTSTHIPAPSENAIESAAVDKAELKRDVPENKEKGVASKVNETKKIEATPAVNTLPLAKQAKNKLSSEERDKGVASKVNETEKFEATPVVTTPPLAKQTKNELPSDEGSVIGEVSKELGAEFKFKLPSYYALIIGIVN